MKTVFRTHDDCDGDTSQGLSVTMDLLGDIYVAVRPGQFADAVRFRTFGGGTMSPNVYRALRKLIDAIELDNKERPFDRTQPTTEKRG